MATTLQRLSAPTDFDTSRVICLWGDSVENGTGAGSLDENIRSVLAVSFTPNRRVVNLGIGGEGPTTIATRVVDEINAWPDAVHIVSFGRPAYGAGAAVYQAAADAVWAVRPNNRLAFLVPGPGANANEKTLDSTQIIEARDCRYSLMEAYPDNHIDHMLALWDGVVGGDSADDLASVPTFDDTQGSVTNSYIDNGRGYCPPKYLADDIHRNGAGQTLIGTTIYDWIAAAGW